MTVAELIKALEKIEDKTLEVVADIGLDFFDNQKTEPIEVAIETEEYFGAIENGHWYGRRRKCVKLVG